MSMALDKQIGCWYYAWTEQETGTNTYYDPWADLWRPRPPDRKGLPTPAFSTSITHALELVKDLSDHHCIATSIFRDIFGSWSVVMRKLGHPVILQHSASQLPEAIVRCAIKLKESEFTYADLQSITADWETEEILSV